MLKKALILLLFAFCVHPGYAQYKDTSVYYYRYVIPNYQYAGSHRVRTPDSADYIRIISPPDSGETLYNIRDVYKNGKLKFVAKALSNPNVNIDFISFQGNAINYFPNGKRRSIVNYDNGFKDGIEYDYYPNGKLYCRIENKRFASAYSNSVNRNRLFLDCYDQNGNMIAKEGYGQWINYDSDFKNIIIQGPIEKGNLDGEWKGGTMDSDSIKFIYKYKKGNLVIAKSYDKTGKEYEFKRSAVPADYKNGTGLFIKMLRERITLPKGDQGKKIRDTVSISFIVGIDGHLSDFEIVGHPNPVLADAALEAAKKSPDWEPRKYYGIPLRSKITIPLDMRIGGDNSFQHTEKVLDMKITSPQEE